jgi:hypothetical protein
MKNAVGYYWRIKESGLEIKDIKLLEDTNE